jgi:hypothetical protein
MDDIRMTQMNTPSQWLPHSRFRVIGIKIAYMKKDTRLTFRVNSNLKRTVESIAAREGQSVARICEAFLLAGSEAYKKQGAKLLQRMLGQLNTRPTE